MPSGFTSGLKDDTPLSEFVLRCARAMGALILMRDDPLDAPIPDGFEPDVYYRKRLDDMIAAKAACDAMTLEDAAADVKRHNGQQRKFREQSATECGETRAKYDRMVEMVEAWQPPTPDHEGLKRFMLEQLRASIEWDCSTSTNYYADWTGTPAEWLAHKRMRAAEDVYRAQQMWDGEVERAKERTAWIKALKQSLK